MKFLAFALSLYFLALVVYPCADTVMDCKDIRTEISFDYDHTQVSDHSELCSPLCFCPCCQMYVDHFELLHYDFFQDSYSKSIFWHFEIIQEETIFKRIQPPRHIA